MAYTDKFQNLADAARSRVGEVLPEDVDALLAEGVIVLDIRDKEEHDTDHIEGSLNISRGKFGDARRGCDSRFRYLNHLLLQRL